MQGSNKIINTQNTFGSVLNGIFEMYKAMRA